MITHKPKKEKLLWKKVQRERSRTTKNNISFSQGLIRKVLLLIFFCIDEYGCLSTHFGSADLLQYIILLKDGSSTEIETHFVDDEEKTHD